MYTYRLQIKWGFNKILKFCSTSSTVRCINHLTNRCCVASSLNAPLLPVHCAWRGAFQGQRHNSASRPEGLKWDDTKLRPAYLFRLSAVEGLHFRCSLGWRCRCCCCCCRRPGCTSTLLIIFCCPLPPPGQHSASSHHLSAHARVPHRVAMTTRDEGTLILPNHAARWKHIQILLFIPVVKNSICNPFQYIQQTVYERVQWHVDECSVALLCN
jgi:hypothetical protein